MAEEEFGVRVDTSGFQRLEQAARFAFERVVRSTRKAEEASVRASRRMRRGFEAYSDEVKASAREHTAQAQDWRRSARLQGLQARRLGQEMARLAADTKAVDAEFKSLIAGSKQVAREHAAQAKAFSRAARLQSTRTAELRSELRQWKRDKAEFGKDEFKELVAAYDKEIEASMARQRDLTRASVEAAEEAASEKMSIAESEMEHRERLRKMDVDRQNLAAKKRDAQDAQIIMEGRAVIASKRAADIRRGLADRQDEHREKLRQEEERRERLALERSRQAQAQGLGYMVGRGYSGLAASPLSPFSGVGPMVGALSGTLIEMSGGLFGRLLEGVADTFLDEGLSQSLLRMGGRSMRYLASALGPAAEGIITSSFGRAQEVYSSYAQYTGSQMLARPFYGRASELGAADVDRFALYAYEPAQAVSSLAQIAQTAGWDPFSGGYLVTEQGDYVRPEMLMLRFLRGGLDPGAAGALGRVFRPGGGGFSFGYPLSIESLLPPEQDFFRTMQIFGRMGTGRGYGAAQLSSMMTGFGGLMSQLGERGIDVYVPEYADFLGQLTGHRGLEGERAVQFMGRMFGGMQNVAGGGGDPLTQFLMLGAAMDVGETDYIDMIRRLEMGDPEIQRALITRLRGLGPRGALVMQRMGLAGSVLQAESILSGETPMTGTGEGFNLFVPRPQQLEAAVGAQRAVLGEQLVPSAVRLAGSLNNIDIVSVQLTHTMERLAGEILPWVSQALVDMVVSGAENLGVISPQRAHELSNMGTLEAVED